MKRPHRLDNTTYKIRPPVIDESVYITVCDYHGRPVELFINSKNMQSFHWISYLTRSVSHRLQEGECVDKIIQEMRDTYDTKGGYIIPKSKGIRANSVVDHIGHVLALHMVRLARKKESKRVETDVQREP